MQDEKRPPPRVGAEIAVQLSYATADEFMAGHAQHVSQGGIFLRLADPIPVGTRVAFQLRLASGEPVLVGSGVVAWVNEPRPELGPSALPGIGVSFTTLDPKSRAIVDLIVAAREPRDGDGGPPRPTAGVPYAESAPPVVKSPAQRPGPAASAVTAAASAARPAVAPVRSKRAGPSRIVGIDLGTTNSCVAIADGDGARVLASKLGYSTVPSIVAYDDRGQLLVGHRAKAQMLLRPTSTVYGSKRLIGRPFVSPTVQACRDRFHYEIIEGEGGAAAVRIEGHVLSLQQVAAAILKELREIASEALGEDVVRAAITVPAYYNDHQRQAVRDAGALAGLRVDRIVNEPTAAAVAFGFGRSLAKRVLVYDLGGGTFDASVVEVEGDIYEVVSTGGDTFLGGVDFDNQLVDHLVQLFREQHGFSPPDDLTVWQRIVEAAEQAKVALSAREAATVHVPQLCAKPGGTLVDLQATVRRTDLETLTRGLVDRTLQVCHEVLQARGLGKADLDDVLLVGGQSRMPFVWRRIREELGREPSKSVHPDEAVALGAALLAHADRRVDSVVLLDALAISIGVGLPGGRMIPVLTRNTRLPARRTYEVATSTDGQSEVELPVFQGDSAQVFECEYLGTVRISGLRAAPAGAVRVAVEFALGNEGILSLRARDAVTGDAVEARLAALDTPQSLREKLQLPGAPVAPRGSRPFVPGANGGGEVPSPAPKQEPPAAGNGKPADEARSAVLPPPVPPPEATEEPSAAASKKGLLSRLFGRR